MPPTIEPVCDMAFEVTVGGGWVGVGLNEITVPRVDVVDVL